MRTLFAFIAGLLVVGQAHAHHPPRAITYAPGCVRVSAFSFAVPVTTTINATATYVPTQLQAVPPVFTTVDPCAPRTVQVVNTVQTPATVTLDPGVQTTTTTYQTAALPTYTAGLVGYVRDPGYAVDFRTYRTAGVARFRDPVVADYAPHVVNPSVVAERIDIRRGLLRTRTTDTVVRADGTVVRTDIRRGPLGRVRESSTTVTAPGIGVRINEFHRHPSVGAVRRDIIRRR